MFQHLPIKANLNTSFTGVSPEEPATHTSPDTSQMFDGVNGIDASLTSENDKHFLARVNNDFPSGLKVTFDGILC